MVQAQAQQQAEITESLEVVCPSRVAFAPQLAVAALFWAP